MIFIQQLCNIFAHHSLIKENCLKIHSVLSEKTTAIFTTENILVLLFAMKSSELSSLTVIFAMQKSKITKS